MMNYLGRLGRSSSKVCHLRHRTPISVRAMSESTSLFNPTNEHKALRDMVRSFVETEVEPQALEYNKLEKFNIELFRKLGELGLLGITVDPEYGGSGMDAVAAVIVHGKLLSFPFVFFCFLSFSFPSFFSSLPFSPLLFLSIS